ncbi:tRNA pseudouridine(55) synthase TruB [Turicimonas muris]|uniref:tRNA pseudouridine synthase B n=5 Tax=Turicimonas muris TaxID=1796652 RepID=A0A227KRZ5_9BURK|nr:tRNA pseudouridine(55) synthase TruB [Turicimonas muris]ANU65459.1 tRNA pseudouridine(55) synthase TruB [Burkholderiales bacterium YL45]MBS4768967.1 tRNA pseudouridine(55) synthase TruB [Burkholderiales bacterium]OXE51269.1 tRNA pseudouridine(55) synthase TruB [Turicimonas muris]QQQ96609.1 tRNA pseudouridine(55) synthase TruB [Turicimonas muris]
MSRRKKGDKIDGVLMLDKPVGLSSNTALQKARRALNAQKAGHTGTLDPFASGLLPLCFGEATKFSADLLHADKEYVASIKFGETTTTADVEGEIIETRPVDFTEEQLHKALESLTGEIDQIPPMYSALKKDGVRLYELARQGQEIEREPRRVTVYELELLSFNKPEALVRVKCSKGTYVRVLGEDIGKILGCGAHLTALRRTKIADIDISEAVSLQDFEEADIAQRLDMLDPPDRLLSQLEPIELKEELAVRFLHGQSIRITRSENSEKKVKVYRLSDGKRELLGCARLSTDGVLSAERLISNSSN